MIPPGHGFPDARRGAGRAGTVSRTCLAAFLLAASGRAVRGNAVVGGPLRSERCRAFRGRDARHACLHGHDARRGGRTAAPAGAPRAGHPAHGVRLSFARGAGSRLLPPAGREQDCAGRASVSSVSAAGIFADELFACENVPGTDCFVTRPGETPGGSHKAQWSLDSGAGEALPSGVCRIVVTGPGGSASARAVVAR